MTTKQAIEGMPNGKHWGLTWGDRNPHAWLRVRHHESGGYELVAGWLVPEKYDEDPESVFCGCPLQGRSHVEAERVYARSDIDALVAAYDLAKDEISSRKTVSFAKAQRVGG